MLRTLLFSSMFLITACSTILDGQMQDITIETPGAKNALCVLNNGDNKYKAYSNQTITIRRSKASLLVNCKAAGNREKTVHVKREVNEWVPYNVANGFVPGAAVDYFSGGAFEYPKKVVVNFIGTPIKPYDLPDYHANDLQYNEKYNNSEYMGPTTVIEPTRGGESTLQKKTLPYSGSASPASGGVYPRSNSIVPYDSSKEIK